MVCSAKTAVQWTLVKLLELRTLKRASFTFNSHPKFSFSLHARPYEVPMEAIMKRFEIQPVARFAGASSRIRRPRVSTLTSPPTLTDSLLTLARAAHSSVLL